MRCRRLLIDSVKTDLRQRYAGSALGFGWAILYPALLLSIYATLYAFVFRIRPDGLTELSYVVLVFSGLVPLLSFNEALMAATGTLLANRGLLLNTVFPAELIPVRAVVAAQVPCFVGLCITLVMAVLQGRASWMTPIAVLVAWVLLVIFTIGLGWILSLVNLLLRDVQQGLSLVLMSLFMLSPVAYTPSMVPDGLKLILYVNPLAYFVTTFQAAICYGTLPDISTGIAIVSMSLISGTLGFWFFRRTRFVFFDYA